MQNACITVASMPSFSESDPNLDCDEEQNTTANQNHDLNSSTTTNYKDDDMNNAEAEPSSNDLLDETNGLGNASVSLADLDLSSDTLNEDLGASRGSPYRNDSNPYDYLLKVLLVGDSDVGKQEILSGLEDGTTDSPFCSTSGAAYKTTTILIDGKRVKLQLWDTSGQGRFCTIIRSYSRGAQGILLVYDITNKW